MSEEEKRKFMERIYEKDAKEVLSRHPEWNNTMAMAQSKGRLVGVALTMSNENLDRLHKILKDSK